MKLTVKDLKGNAQGEFEVSLQLIENNRATQAVHDTVVAHMANRRMGTACAKRVGEVSGSNKKPWRQKGTGRARAGSFQSPLWVGGGVVFGPRPRDFGKKVNDKTRQLALRKALSERLKAGDVVLVEDLKLPAAKTKNFLEVLTALDINGTALIISAGPDRTVSLASRNIPFVEVATSETLNTYQVLKSDKLVFTRGAFEALQARLGK
jgi:large subunit ribosomal protein L4